MNILKKFSKQAKRDGLRTRLNQVIMIDREVEGGLSQIAPYIKYGKYWYNCIKSPEGLWWI